MGDLSVRVFRRNNKNIIILWQPDQLDPSFVSPVVASLVEPDGKETLLAYNKFKPDSPEKFPKKVDGIVISHLNNNLDANVGYKIKLSFRNGHIYQEAVQEVAPVSSNIQAEIAHTTEAIHMYAYDYKNRKWVPLPVDQRLIVE